MTHCASMAWKLLMKAETPCLPNWDVAREWLTVVEIVGAVQPDLGHSLSPLLHLYLRVASKCFHEACPLCCLLSAFHAIVRS